MSARIVEARFAGGQLTVEAGEFVGSRVVTLDMPGATVTPFFPDEARRLAVALIEQAARAEAPEAGDWP